MLIDMDLFKPLPDSLMHDVGEDCLFFSLDYENLLTFCSSCCSIDHVASACPRPGNPTPRRRPMIMGGKKQSPHEFRMLTAAKDKPKEAQKDATARVYRTIHTTLEDKPSTTYNEKTLEDQVRAKKFEKILQMPLNGVTIS